MRRSILRPFEAAERALRADALVGVVALADQAIPAEAVRLGQVGVAEYVERAAEQPLDWLLERLELALPKRLATRARSGFDAFASLRVTAPPWIASRTSPA
ncbi:MAG: hypothetical protein R2748_29505 [Bryobacterales bacterium]